MDDKRVSTILNSYAKVEWVLGVSAGIFSIAIILNCVGYTEKQDATFLSGLILMLLIGIFLGLMYWSLYNKFTKDNTYRTKGREFINTGKKMFGV